MMQIDRDYLTSMRALEQLLDPDDTSKVGVSTALNNLNSDNTFKALTGVMGGKSWRLTATPEDIGTIDFSIKQTASQKINVAQMDLVISFEIEK
jgi:hypothetical protein